MYRKYSRKRLVARSQQKPYADDTLIFVKSEKAANRVMKSIVRFIEEKLGLIVNAEKRKVSRPKELKFLGFGYYYDSKNKRIQVRPHPISVQTFQRKLRQLTKKLECFVRLSNIETKNKSYSDG